MAKSTTEVQETTNQGSEAHVRLVNVTKTFGGGDIVAVKNFNLEIGSDEFVVFLGPSGCGKTTTLRCISGLEEPDSGQISINGREVTYAKPKDRNLAFVFQNIALFPHMKVRKNMQFGLDMNSDRSSTEKEERVREAAEILGITDLLDRKPAELSGGQQQRVALGRAMVIDPEAFLLDEPFSALDANLRDKMQTEIQHLQNQIGKSMIFVTHDQKEAMTLGDRIVVMKDGEIQQVGTPYEIYNEPVNLFVAQFIGSPSTNLLDATVEREGGVVTISNELLSLTLTEEQSKKLTDFYKDTVTLSVRPEQLQLGQNDTALFRAEIEVIEPQGNQDVIHLSVDGRDLRALTTQGKFTESGQQVDVAVNAENVSLFNSTGDRVL